jgi:hypothetical protein
MRKNALLTKTQNYFFDFSYLKMLLKWFNSMYQLKLKAKNRQRVTVMYDGEGANGLIQYINIPPPPPYPLLNGQSSEPNFLSFLNSQ